MKPVESLTQLEKISNHETFVHIQRVQRMLLTAACELNIRALEHDQSKLCSPEVEIFAENAEILNQIEFGSAEYDKCRERVQEALKHHYQNNRHHPEHFLSGIDGMNLIDVLEMVIDWMASTKRMKGGDIEKSIEILSNRFGISEQLKQIIKNTVVHLQKSTR